MRDAIFASVLVLAACGGSDPLKPDAPDAEAGAPKPGATPPDAAALRPEDARFAAINLLCGGESLRVAFEDQRAVIINDNGGNTELARLPAGPDADPGVATYTDGRISFYRSGGDDTQTVVRFSRGRMAPQDCAIAAN